MVDPAVNPYRSDAPANEWFVGRDAELAAAVRAITSGRQALMAFMGGRGMGKSSLLRAIEARVSAEPGIAVLRFDRPPRDPKVLAQKLCSVVGGSASPDDLTTLGPALRVAGQPRLCVLIDEIEVLLDAPLGSDLLENLRVAYENAPGSLAVLVFGGSKLRKLLASDASPFLRTARLFALHGLSLDATAKLMREPFALALGEDIVARVWADTNGHPLLLQRTMERTVDEVSDGSSEAATILVRVAGSTDPDDTLFGLWWENIAPEGQRVFEKLVAEPAGVRDEDAARVLGNRPFEQLEVLESTGVARRNGGLTLPRGELFRRWFERNHRRRPTAAEQTRGVADELWRAVGAVGNFEQSVIDGVAVWFHAMLEFPAYALREVPGGSGNDLLQEEDYFQLSLVQALRQRGYVVEAEALSVGRKDRSDVKVRGAQPGERACGEMKRWAGTPSTYKRIVDQVIGYAMPTDTFAFAVMVDRIARPLAPVYLRDCIPRDAVHRLPPLGGREVRIPAFVTEHLRTNAQPLRVYHFLLQLPYGRDAP